MLSGPQTIEVFSRLTAHPSSKTVTQSIDSENRKSKRFAYSSATSTLNKREVSWNTELKYLANE